MTVWLGLGSRVKQSHYEQPLDLKSTTVATNQEHSSPKWTAEQPLQLRLHLILFRLVDSAFMASHTQSHVLP
jgi:hypothetical protein